MRSVIIHYHLFKNAGTTLDGILERSIPAHEHGHIEGPHPWSTVDPDELLDFVLTHPELRAVSSHQARLPLPRHPSITFLPLLCVRHPIDRFASVYEFERRQSPDSTSPSVPVAQAGGLAHFAEWVVGRQATAVCRNFQVIHMSGVQGDMRGARATHEDYERALARLSALPFFGLVESFDESLAGFQEVLRPVVGELKLDFEIRNSSERRGALEDRLAHIERELGAPLYRELLEHNALDMLLYRRARQIFQSKRTAAQNLK